MTTADAQLRLIAMINRLLEQAREARGSRDHGAADWYAGDAKAVGMALASLIDTGGEGAG